MWEKVFYWTVLIRGLIVIFVILDSLTATWRHSRRGTVFEAGSLVLELLVCFGAASLLWLRYVG